MPRHKPHALTFDVFGTVVDWRTPVIREGEILTRSRKAPEVDWERFADSWRAGYPVAMDRVRKGEIPWTNLDALHRQILNGLLPEFGIHGLTEADLDHLNRVWHRLDPWPDSVEGLERLRRRFTVATLSNGNVSLLVELSKHGGLTWDCVLSAELARHYKPDREVYEMAASYLGLEPRQVMMVAAHKKDLLAAQSVGFQTAYVHRPGEKGPYGKEEGGGNFDVSAHDFLDLAAKLG
jgi:2-haloacid dehalogenase